MLELIGIIALTWLVFRVLDAVFRGKGKQPDRVYIIRENGERYRVSEFDLPEDEQEADQRSLPKNVVSIRGSRRG
jgi:hypothetical protein